MKRTLKGLIVAAALVSGPLFAQGSVPEIAFDANADLLKTPNDIYVGEVAGVATNSKGQIYVYTRTGQPYATLGSNRTFYRGGSRLFQFDQNGRFVRELGQDVYGFNAAMGLRIDAQDNIWTIDAGANQVVKFEPDGRYGNLALGRKPETISVRTGERGGGARGAAPGGAPPTAAPGAAAPARGGAPDAGRGGRGAGGRGGAGGGGGGGAAGAGAGGRGADAQAARGGAAPPAAGAAAQAPAAGRGAGGRGGNLPGSGTPGPGFSRPTDVAFDKDGNLYVADGIGNNNRVAKFNKDGRFLKHWGSTGTGNDQFQGVKAIAVDAQGNVYVADMGNKRIQVFDGEGTYKSTITNVGTPISLCMTRGATQYLYVGHSGDPDGMEDGAIYKVALDGRIVGKFGRAGKLPKEFGIANSIDCRNENELLVGEMTNWRVQKVTLKVAR
jgi:hypothetical protein